MCCRPPSGSILPEDRDSAEKGKGLDIAIQALEKNPGIELLSHTLMYSTIAAGPLNDRVRDGNVCDKPAIDTGKNI